MIRILVLSDTHLSRGGDAKNLFRTPREPIQTADLIIHAGDHTGIGFYYDLERVGTVVAVCGNMDDFPLRGELPQSTTIEREGLRSGVTHGWGSAKGLPERIYEVWDEPKPDILVFGHSHQTYVNHLGQTLLFNPGSPTYPSGPYPTAGWIEIDQGTVHADHIPLT